MSDESAGAIISDAAAPAIVKGRRLASGDVELRVADREIVLSREAWAELVAGVTARGASPSTVAAAARLHRGEIG